MKLTQEIPAKSDRDYKVAGLSRAENKRFWLTEDLVFYYFHRVLGVFLVLFVVMVESLFFIIDFDVHWTSYVFFQTMHIAHASYMAYWFLQSLYTINLSYMIVMLFFVKRFRFVSKHLRRMKKPINNRKQSRLICDHNRIETELLEMNEFFKNFLGANLVHFFFHGIMFAFIAIDPTTDWRLSIAFFGLVAAIFTMVIYIQSIIASSVLNEVRAQIG